MKNQLPVISQMVNKQDIAELFNIKKGTVYKWMKSPGFPLPLRRGRVVRWKVSQIQEWIDAQTSGSNPPRRGRPRARQGVFNK